MKWLIVLCVLTSAAVGDLSSAHAQSAAAAIMEAQRTGQPIFAVAGTTYCPHCITLMKRLNTEDRLQPLIAQFVPLKLDVSSRDFKAWERFFPRQKSAIPALYIVTPQGDQLYGKIGSLPTEGLEKVMIDTLTKAGRFPSEGEWKELDELARQAEKLLDEGEVLKAIELMHPQLVHPIFSSEVIEYHETGERILKLGERIEAAGLRYCNNLITNVSRRSLMEQALEIVKARRVLVVSPALAKEVARAEKSFGRTAEARRMLRRAREYDRAVAMLSDDDSKQAAKAVRTLKRIVERYPETDEVAVLAAAELQQFQDSVVAEKD